jgi:ABC-type branched-subunit amino acid transport system substrate-binding protein
VFFEALNAKGGVGGKYKVELVQEDSQYKTDVAVQKYNKIKGDVVAFTQILGTAPTLAVLPQLKTDKILAAPASLDALWVREENLLPIGGPYQVQAINAMDYYLSDGGGSKSDTICTMIQDDVYGEAGQQGIDFAAEKDGFKVANTQKFKVGTENYAGQIGALAGAGCKMVFLVATPSDAAKIWGTAAQARFAPQWIGQSPSYTGALAKSAVAPYMQQSVLIVAEGTEWGDNSVPGMKAMVDGATKYAPDQEPDYYFAFGYNQARAMTAVLEKAVELGDLSRAGILKASKELGTVKFEGLSGDYKYGPAETRNPPRTSTIFAVDPTKPFGLKKVKYNFASDAAKEFEFEKADL